LAALTAKMAEIARNLPKWQPPANIVPKAKILFCYFFLFDIQGMAGRIPIYLAERKRK
jgi:hypothetical protein